MGRAKVRLDQRFLKQQREITYLTLEKEPISLSSNTVLIGDDGLADGTLGDFLSSPVEMRDYAEINDFSNLSKRQRFAKLKQLGLETKERLRGKLLSACAKGDYIVLLVHAPPFIEACLYRNQIADKNWAPHFTSGSIGQLILEVMPKFPHKFLLVLAGHTHHCADFLPLPNVRVLVGGAEYGLPQIQSSLSLPR